jgi:MtN3 and saliva related transmembrane protein
MIELFGHLGAFLLSLSSAPQLYKTLRTKDVSGLSLPMLLLWGFGCLFMGIYVLMTTQQPPLLINYAFNTTLVFTNIVLYLMYRDNKS